MTHSVGSLGDVLSRHRSSKQISKCLPAWQIITSLYNTSSQGLAPTRGLKKIQTLPTLSNPARQAHSVDKPCALAAYNSLIDLSSLIVCQKRVCFDQIGMLRPGGDHDIIFRSTMKTNSTVEIRLKTNSETNSTCHILINSLPVGIQCYWYADRVTSACPISCHKQL